MPTITFTCETITPMFLSGADGTTPELRAPSIKGALRFWWRAMNGHLVNSKGHQFKDLLDEDEKLFGGVNGGGKSSVLVRVTDVNKISIDGKKLQSYAEYDATNRKEPYRKAGLAYLYYVLLNQKLQGLEGFDVKTIFNVTLSSENEKDLLQAVACFWLFVHLGGLGSRARRGAGCIQVTLIPTGERYLFDDNKKQIISFLLTNTNNIASYYSQNYKQCIEILQKPRTPDNYSKDNDKYSTLTSNEIYTSTMPFKSWIEALDDIGLKMKEVRDFFLAENRKFRLKDIPKKAAFGLPIKIRDTKENRQRGIPAFEGYYVDLENSSRRASPLIISIFKRDKKNDNPEYYWVLSCLDGTYTDSENSIVIRNLEAEIHSKNGKEFKWPNADRSLVTAFLNKLTKTRITL